MSPCHQTQFPCINYHVLQAWLTINIIIKVCMMFMDIETWRFEFYFKGWNAIKYFAFTVWTKTQQQIPESLSCRYAFTFFFFFIQIFGKWLDVNFIREIFLIFQQGMLLQVTHMSVWLLSNCFWLLGNWGIKF